VISGLRVSRKKMAVNPQMAPIIVKPSATEIFFIPESFGTIF
jgi:hypothetical protein